MHVGLSRSFKLRVFCHQQGGASSKASQAATDPEQAFWSSIALQHCSPCPAIPTWQQDIPHSCSKGEWGKRVES